MIKIIIPGQPKRWERSRHNGKRHFDSASQIENKSAYAWYARKAYGGAPLEIPLVVSVISYFKPSQSLLKSCEHEITQEILPYTKTPDADNICKLVGDALNGIIWKDDSCISWMPSLKLYALVPRTEITVCKLDITKVDKIKAFLSGLEETAKC